MFCLAGEAGSGKGFAVLDLLLSIALGRPYRGTIPVKQGAVAYVVAEGWGGIPQRIAAWLAFHEIAADVEVPLYCIPASPQLNLPGEADTLCRTLTALPTPLTTTVIDTLARTLAGSDSDPRDMNPYINTIGRLQREIGGNVGPVHHSGWNPERERGYSGLRGAVDTMLFVTARRSPRDLELLEAEGRHRVRPARL